MPGHSEGAIKGLRVTKSLGSRRSWHLTYSDYTEQESHDNTFKCHYKHGRATVIIDLLSEELLKFPWYPLGN